MSSSFTGREPRADKGRSLCKKRVMLPAPGGFAQRVGLLNLGYRIAQLWNKYFLGKAAPGQILAWFVRRWQLEVIFQEVQVHLGVETQQQWSDLAIGRTTPALLGLFSLVTLLAGQLVGAAEFPRRQAACYAKGQPTFAAALALVRRYLWQPTHFYMSPKNADMVKILRSLFERFTNTHATLLKMDKVELSIVPFINLSVHRKRLGAKQDL